MKTYFASPDRSSADNLKAEIEFIGNNAIINALLHSVNGLLAVLNSNRQIVALNDSLLMLLGITDTDKVFGLRPGEALKCIHSNEMPGGCGTSEFCSTCGAAISIVSSLAKNRPVERECALTSEESGKKQDVYFRVRCVPILYNTNRYQLLFLQDITYHQRLAALERVFFHDVNGIISGILSASTLISSESTQDIRDLSKTVYRLSSRLASEVSMQQCLCQTEACVYQPVMSPISLAQVFQDIKDIFANNPVSKNRRLALPSEFPNVDINTDASLFLRVISNMITNAFEETEEGEEVKVWVDIVEGKISFCVHNKKPMPATVAKRIFQRNFSTKSGIGRGLGTYSMKLFGEEILGGKIDFTSAEEEGTVFRYSMSI